MKTICDALHDEYGVEARSYRKLFYRVCRELDIPKEICNFYQSRIKKLDVGDINYDDLIKRADSFYPRILNTLRNYFNINTITSLGKH